MTLSARPRSQMAADQEGNYEVGYGKPPRHTRFQKGRSGNPAGRPRGKKNLATLLSDALDQKIIVVESGRRKKISKREAIVTQLVNKSASADLKATQILLAMLRDVETRAASGCAEIGSLTEADRQIIQRIQARIRRERGRPMDPVYRQPARCPLRSVLGAPRSGAINRMDSIS